jgi:hypothetical protein
MIENGNLIGHANSEAWHAPVKSETQTDSPKGKHILYLNRNESKIYLQKDKQKKTMMLD